ncbi:S41 family peptidase [Anaerobium acetethylicum]|uniref:Carboxyl-terminal processing protease n=1 Tax=Anaerobium acetethylicum TaxID=1619234 RepID=A0A1D3TQ95_9FIRM|nr:S41 family peptidase [Anaerobium acetethylicum]SCP95689.1 carboxyl-terminal processing protease [Anaerobium acetethylicum]
MNEKHRFLKGFLAGFGAMLLLVIAGVSAVIFFNIQSITTWLRNASAVSTENAESVTSDSVISKADRIMSIIDANFLNEADEEQMIEGMYKGLVDGLEDPYSVYFDAEEYQSMMESTNGIYGGIGVTVSQDPETGIITLVKPFEGSPGMEAGILPGDILYKVNGEEVTGEDLSEVVAKIKGEEGTKVLLTIVREGEADYIDVEVVRRQIEVPTIASKMLENNIGYIQIVEFDEVTPDQFKEALSSLEKQGMKGLVVDLRDNPGGLLSAVNEILDQFLAKGLIVYTEDKNGKREEYLSDEEHQFNKPLAVLVNGNSASASEIFSGAIKDYGIGTLIGTTTFGKGIVQTVVDLGDGTAMKLTISKYYTPKGNNIHGIGIEPDIALELDDAVRQKAVITEEEDNQLQKALEVLNEKIK